MALRPRKPAHARADLLICGESALWVAAVMLASVLRIK
jgi:hypothetical protein